MSGKPRISYRQIATCCNLLLLLLLLLLEKDSVLRIMRRRCACVVSEKGYGFFADNTATTTVISTIHAPPAAVSMRLSSSGKDPKFRGREKKKSEYKPQRPRLSPPSGSQRPLTSITVSTVVTALQTLLLYQMLY